HTGRATHMRARPPRVRLRGLNAWLAVLATGLPVLAGFGIPLFIFGRYASRRLEQFTSPAVTHAFANSIVTAAITALVTVVLALFLLNAVRLCRSRTITATVR